MGHMIHMVRRALSSCVSEGPCLRRFSSAFFDTPRLQPYAYLGRARAYCSQGILRRMPQAVYKILLDSPLRRPPPPPTVHNGRGSAHALLVYEHL